MARRALAPTSSMRPFWRSSSSMTTSGQHHLVLLETEGGGGVGEKHTGVEDVGAGLGCGGHWAPGSQAGGREARIVGPAGRRPGTG